MGLGPPVCYNCKVICDLDNKTKIWSCPSCGDDDTNGFLFETVDQSTYEQNTKFIKFMKGESNGNS